jgi:D-lactate dehydrogenase
VEVKRYEALMDNVKTLVIDTYNGSLKAEHGTGRNMAPFVNYEWGEAAFKVMKSVKQLFDPKNLLNPGVIFNDDPNCHIKHFKPFPLANSHIDKCIECGFCEVNCLTCGFTLSSRQRIVIQREIARLKQSGENPGYRRRLEKQYRYAGEQTCAGDGLCATSCPMEINTGDLTHDVRREDMRKHPFADKTGRWVANHFAGVKSVLRLALRFANLIHKLLGTKLMSSITRKMHTLFDIPLWTPSMPKAFRQSGQRMLNGQKSGRNGLKSVVYFPSCINQTMGTASGSSEKTPLVNKMVSLLQKAGYKVIFPDGMERLCCGTIWESKGMPDVADRKAGELEVALWQASKQGEYPVLCDQSPCLYRMRHTIRKMHLYEPAEFIYDFLRDKLLFTPIQEPVAIHLTCSMRKMGLNNKLISLAKLCAEEVIIPDEVGCCGFAGDKGFTRPEVNAYALRKLHPSLENTGVRTGYSNSRTCEIGLTTHSGVPYQSIVYLVDRCTKPLLSVAQPR